MTDAPRTATPDVYQSRATSQVDALLRQGCDAVLVAPVGSGKTRMTLQLAEGAREHGGRTVVAQGSVGLCAQNAARAAERFDVRVWADGERPRGGEVVYGVVNTMVDHVQDLGDVDLLVVDEGHHAKDRDGGLYRRFIDQVVEANPDVRIVMTTATPERPDGARLHPRIEAAEAVSVTWREAIDAGMLVLPDAHQGRVTLSDGRTIQDHARGLIDPARPSRSAIGVNAAIRDLRPDDLVEQWAQQWDSRPALTSRQTLFFVDRVDDADALAAALRERGHAVGAVHSRMRPDRVEATVEAYRSGALRGLASVDMIGEGFDAPDTGAIVNCKGSTSATEYVQMVGRATRAARGKTACHYLELGASLLMHGRFDVIAAVEEHVNGGRPRSSEPGRWRPWTSCAKDTVGIDLGSRAVFARRLDDDRFLVSTTLSERDGTTRIGKVGVMSPHEVRAMGREAIASARKTVVTLCSDVDEAGRTQMANRLRALATRHAGSLEVLAAGEVPRRPLAPKGVVVASGASRPSSRSLGR